MGAKSAKKDSRKLTPKKKSPKKVCETDENDFVMRCTRENVKAVMELIKGKIQASKERTLDLKIQKCKSIPGRIPGVAKCTKFLPCSVTHKSVHLRNALISHNWTDASFLLLSMLKDPKDPLLYRNIWKAFFIILQQSPHADYARMEQFRELCLQVTGKDNFLDVLYLR